MSFVLYLLLFLKTFQTGNNNWQFKNVTWRGVEQLNIFKDILCQTAVSYLEIVNLWMSFEMLLKNSI